MTLDESIRMIVREELARFAESLAPTERSREWLSMTQLAEALGVGLPTIKAMMRRGCPHVWPDARPRFSLAQVTTWLVTEGKDHATHDQG